MNFASILGFIATLERYRPLVSVLTEYGGEVWSAVAPLVQKSANAGTLERDVTNVIQATKSLVPVLTPVVGPFESLGHVADALKSIGPADLGNPAPSQDHLARPDRMGGR